MIRGLAMPDQVVVKSESELEECGRVLARTLEAGNVVFLQGGIGAGKTTIARGILRGFGYCGIAPSPTYTLMETYELDQVRIVHMDLYRIERSQDLESIGIRDYFDGQAIFLIEWPDQMLAILPEPDLRISLSTALEGRSIQIESKHLDFRIAS